MSGIDALTEMAGRARDEPLESTLTTARLRTRHNKSASSSAASLTMVFTLLLSGQRRSASSGGIRAPEALGKMRIMLVDMNGDGLVDFISSAHDYGFVVRHNTGSGAGPQRQEQRERQHGQQEETSEWTICSA